MALPILDGNQTSTTLATTVSGGAHYPNHIIASGTVTANGFDFNNTSYNPIPLAPFDEATSGGKAVVAKIVDDNGSGLNLSAGVPISGTVTASVFGTKSSDESGTQLPVLPVQLVNLSEEIVGVPSNPLPISGTVTANMGNVENLIGGGYTNLTEVLNDGAIVVQSIETAINVNEISALPPISGTVTANLPNSSLNPLGVSIWNDSNQLVGADVPMVVGGVVTIAGSTEFRSLQVSTQGSASVFGTVTVGNSVTVSSLPVQLSTTTIGGTARLNVTLSSATTVGATVPSYANLYGGSDGTNLRAISVDSSGRTVVTGSVSVANTTVTISALPSGSLTTRFGSVTTANTAQLTAAVTNSARKYLLAQNISAGTVTIGIGFSPTTTQGIQLSAGGGLSFDAFCPTGAVWWLSATTGANFTILEG